MLLRHAFQSSSRFCGKWMVGVTRNKQLKGLNRPWPQRRFVLFPNRGVGVAGHGNRLFFFGGVPFICGCIPDHEGLPFSKNLSKF